MFGIASDIDQYLKRVQEELARVDRGKVRQLADWVYEAWKSESTVFVFGNGGSGATASHLSEDLNKNALRPEDLQDANAQRPRVLSLSDNTSWITAIGNDLGFEQVFAQQLAHFGRPGDIVVAISGSGNSPNILAAVQWANQQGLKTFGLTGFDGGKLLRIAQAGLCVPVDDMGMVESIHLAIGHWLVDDLHARVNAAGRYAIQESQAGQVP